MKTKTQVQGDKKSRRPANATKPAPRATRVRTRCREQRTAEEEVQLQIQRALPQIVRATVNKAKGGSLVHTKWLWGVAAKSDARGPAGEETRASLAALLLEQLNETR